MTKKYYIVEASSTFYTRYIVASDQFPKKEQLQILIDEAELKQAFQQFLGEIVTEIREATETEQKTFMLDVNELETPVDVEKEES